MFYKNKRGNLQPDSSSIMLNLKPILAARNINHPYVFLLKLGINNNSVNKMLKGTAVQINFKQLTKLCMALCCTPNDILALRNLELPDNHPLQALHSFDDEGTKIAEWLKTKTLDQVKELMKAE